MHIDDEVKINHPGLGIMTVYIAGLERYAGKGSPIERFKYYLDWDEGPIEYWVSTKEIIHNEKI